MRAAHWRHDGVPACGIASSTSSFVGRSAWTSAGRVGQQKAHRQHDGVARVIVLRDLPRHRRRRHPTLPPRMHESAWRELRQRLVELPVHLNSLLNAVSGIFTGAMAPAFPVPARRFPNRRALPSRSTAFSALSARRRRTGTRRRARS
jgi:hypothetical protein